MRIAVPLLGEEVAPRFCSASRLLLVDADEHGHELRRSDIALPAAPIPARLLTLASLGVTCLLCGGLNRRYRPLAERLGMHVEWRLVGAADAQVAAYLAGKPLRRLPCGRCAREEPRRKPAHHESDPPDPHSPNPDHEDTL